jgi:CubicO group peptidase (beta-lactamase class C family)
MSLVGGALLLAFFTAGQVPHQSEIENYVLAQKTALNIPGLSLGVVYKGSVYKKSWGNANEELSVPATADTVYELASMSKPLVATAAMLLMRDRKPPFALEDKVCKHLPEVPGAWGNITIRHLLSHLSGIKEYLLIPEFSTRREYSDGELLNMAARYPLNFPPGEQFNYTNTGYCILTMIIERTTRRPYGDILKERIFTPLGMTSTRVNDSTAIIPRRASGYTFRFGSRFHADFVARTQLAFGDCGVVSTLNDLLLLDKELWKADSTILPKDMLDQMWTPAKLNDRTAYQRYGLGWELYCDEKGKVTEVYHGGAIEGFRSIILRYLADKLTVIVLFNGELDAGVNDDFATHIADLAYGLKPGERRVMRAKVETRHASLPRN